MVLYIFNPDTDLALANGKGNYTPTERVRQMIADLSMLPIWYAQPGSFILSDRAENQVFLKEMNELFGCDVQLFSLADLPSLTEPFEVHPWGWNRSFRNKLVRAGIAAQYLPTDLELDHRRQLSQRKIVCMLLELFDNTSNFCGISRNVTDTAYCEQYFSMMKDQGGVVFKEPWSSSGKGLLWCRDDFNDRDKNWCQRVISNQGYVTVMPIYNKVQDFAMEFQVNETPDRPVTFLGYSLFDTDKKGAYQGNVLLSNEEIEHSLVKYVPKPSLEKTFQIVSSFLAQQGYKGCVGVDMMICQEPDGMCIHPCVEINYRHTMGYVARVIKDRFLAEQAQGRFMIQHFHTSKELAAFVHDHQQKMPLVIKEGKVHAGFLPLVPVTPTTQNLAYIEV
jgi:hypothetical protein